MTWLKLGIMACAPLVMASGGAGEGEGGEPKVMRSDLLHI